jgi:Baseplate J-like protein
MADATTVLNRLIAALTAQDPTWDIGVGTAEYKILEAVSQEIATAANNNTLQNYSFDITTKSGADLDSFCALFGIYRDLGKRATGTATFSTSTSGLGAGTLTVQNATSGTFTASYSPTNTTSVSINFNDGANVIQSAITSIVPTNTVVNVGSPSSGVYNITFTPALPNNSINFNFSSLVSTSTSALVTSWTPAGGASANYEIPSGTQIYASAQRTGTIPIYYQTTTAAILPKGQTSITVPIQAVLTGTNANLIAGTISGFSTQLTGITQVTNSQLSGGTDPETDAQLIQRWQNTVFKNLAGTEDQFLALAFGNPDTTRATVLGPQTQNTENLQIQTVLSNAQKTGIASNPPTETPGGLIATITGAICSGGVSTYNLSYPYSGATFNVGDFVSIEGVSENGTGVNAPSTTNTFNTTGIITAVNPAGANTVSISNTTTTVYSSATAGKMTRIPNTVTVDNTKTFTLDYEVDLTATWTVSGQNVTLIVPAGTSTSGILPGLTAISGSKLTEAMNVQVVATPTLNSDGTTTVLLYQYGSGTPLQAINPTPVAFMLPTTITITGASGGFTTSGTPTTTYTINDNNTFFIPGQYVTISGISQSGGTGSFNVSGNVIASGNSFFTILNNCTATYVSGGTATISYNGNTQLATLQAAVTAGYNNTPAIDPQQIVTLDTFYNSGILNIAATGGSYTVTTPVAALAGSSPKTITWNAGAVTTANVAGVQDALNSLLLAYGIQCSVYRSSQSLGYKYIIDFYSTDYAYSVDASGTNYYYFVPVDVSYVTTLLNWNFVSLTGPATSNATWTAASGVTSTIAQAAAIDFVFSKPATVPVSFTYTGSGLNPYSFANTVTSTLDNAQYFYPMGLESVQSGFAVNEVSSVASPYLDYIYNPTFQSPSQATVTILNGNNYDWLYPGNVIKFSYYYVDEVSRNTPIRFNGGSPTIYTNYVDVIIDGTKPTAAIEDGVINSNNTFPAPGSGGLMNNDNATKWNLGDQVSNPPVDDYYYCFSQQPVTQPFIGIFPETISLGAFSRTDAGCSWQTSPPTTVNGAGNATLLTTGSTVTLTNSSYINLSVSSPPISANFMYGPATFTLTISGVQYQVWYSGFNATSTWGNTYQLLNCILIDGTTNLNVPSGSTIIQSTITDPNCSVGDTGAYVTSSTSGFPANTYITSVAPGVKFVVSNPVTATGSNKSISISRDSYLMSAYSGPLGVINATMLDVSNYEWIPGNTVSTSTSATSTPILSVNSEEPAFGQVNTVQGSYYVTTPTNINPIYYNMVPNLNNVPFGSYVKSYSRAGSNIELSYPSATSSMFYGNTIFTSDFYPIYDASELGNSPLAITGIGIRQPTKQTRVVSWTAGGTTILDPNAQSLDLGSFIVGTNIPPQAYITTVTPGYGYTIGFNISSYNSLTLTSSGTNQTVTLIPFTKMSQLPSGTNIQLFGMNYNYNADVQEVDSLIQQQRLVGVSTLTHGADIQNILVNLAVVPTLSVNPTSLTTAIENSIISYFSSIQFSQPIQIASILQAALQTQGVQNVRLATKYDSPNYFGIQIVNPYMFYDSAQDLVQGAADSIEIQDLVVIQTYTKDVRLDSDQIPQLFKVNLYIRSESDF